MKLNALLKPQSHRFSIQIRNNLWRCMSRDFEIIGRWHARLSRNQQLSCKSGEMTLASQPLHTTCPDSLGSFVCAPEVSESASLKGFQRKLKVVNGINLGSLKICLIRNNASGGQEVWTRNFTKQERCYVVKYKFILLSSQYTLLEISCSTLHSRSPCTGKTVVLLEGRRLP